MIDYAPHKIHMTYLLKRLGNHLLRHQVQEAKETCLLIQTEAKLLTNAVNLLESQHRSGISSNVCEND